MATVAMPALAAAIETELGKEEQSIKLDPEDKDRQTLPTLLTGRTASDRSSSHQTKN